MHKSIRQSMAWLHSWLGLMLGWVLFCIFLLGATSYYRQEINAWMQPQFNHTEINQQQAIQNAWEYLEENAHDAKSWYISVANSQHPTSNVYWQKSDGSYAIKNLDPVTGQEIQAATTQGGDFFYNFHFQLFGVPYMIGRLIVSFAAFIMLIALISGVITHKKIFTDFFTFRTFKGQRSWLDFHNVVSVIALPFFLTITFTGLTIFFNLYLPYGIQQVYSPKQSLQFFEEINSTQPISTAQGQSTAMLTFEQLNHKIQQQWPNQPEISTIEIKAPYTSLAQIQIKQLEDHSISLKPEQLSIAGSTGQILPDFRNYSPVTTLYSGVYGLHMAPFAQPLLRLGLFFSGLLGCAMIASGLLLWSLKRQLHAKSQSFHFGHYLVDRGNLACFVGLPISMLVYFYLNRLVTPYIHGNNYEIQGFFLTWLISLVAALFTKKAYLWRSQLTILIALATLLPLVDYYSLYQQHLLFSQSYWTYLRVDLFFWLFAGLAFLIYRNIQPIQQQAHQRIQRKSSLNSELETKS